jgi:4'-phosphopantetheinyl transferase
MVESSRTSDLRGLTSWPRGPLRPDYPAGEVHVWIGLLDREWPDAEGLPSGERERAAALVRPLPARRWVASRWLLRGVLGRYLGEEPAAVALADGEREKPRLRDPDARLRFNLSHSDAVALVAVSADREVGVDVERVVERRDPVALAARELSDADVDAVRAAPPERRAAVFHRVWACHEARLKCLGLGLGRPLPPAPVALLPLDLGPPYAAAVAAAGEEPIALRRWSLDPG